ncbi:hypothetical protein D1AOALGA4SA_11971 [Olavius algarvensis Delta 1 endosymbiont]|nr:hypothetical protein D1AOALGA4SA_11971 [Olavius algarvensis Delta 1 endosymbiont]
MGSVLQNLGLTDRLCGAGCGSWLDCGGDLQTAVSPIDGKVLGSAKGMAHGAWCSVFGVRYSVFGARHKTLGVHLYA